MNIRLICVGKIKEKYLVQGISEYKKRLSRYAKLEIIEVQDEKAPESLPCRRTGGAGKGRGTSNKVYAG